LSPVFKGQPAIFEKKKKHMEKTKLADEVIKGFRKAATELEKFQLQFALGKAEAKDKYEELKKDFNARLHAAKLKAIKGKEHAQKLHQLIDELQVQLALGKAETKDAFDKQRKKINATMHEIELWIKAHPALLNAYDNLLEEFEKIRIKLEILWVNYKISRLTTKDSIEKRRAEMDKIMADLKASVTKQKKQKESKWQHFGSEMSEAFTHLKAAFVG
jgi:hypothetical protein